MIRFRAFILLLLLTSSSVLLVYSRPATHVEVLPTETTEVIVLLDTAEVTITTESPVTYSVTVYDVDNSDPVFSVLNTSNEIREDVGEPGMYRFEIETSRITTIVIDSVGIPPIIWMYLGFLLVLTIVLYRREILYKISR